MKVLMLHGFLGDRSDWTDFVAAARIALPDLEADTPDLPGHGHRPEPVPEDFAGWVAWVRGRLDAAGGPVHLLGYSMGGRLALAAAVAEAGTDRVASLAVLAASPGIVDATARAERRRVDAERADRLQRDGLTAFLEQWYGMPLFQPAIELVGLELLVARRSRGQAHALAAALITAGAGMMPDLRPRLERLAIPVLAIAGDRDSRYMNLEQDIAALAPAGQFAVVPGAGHALLVEAPERCAAFWRAFVLSANLAEGASP